jgi:hypothetical protein
MQTTCSSLKNSRSTWPCASAQAELRSSWAAAKVTSSKRRLSIGRLISASSCAQRTITSGRWQNTLA